MMGVLSQLLETEYAPHGEKDYVLKSAIFIIGYWKTKLMMPYINKCQSKIPSFSECCYVVVMSDKNKLYRFTFSFFFVN